MTPVAPPPGCTILIIYCDCIIQTKITPKVSIVFITHLLGYPCGFFLLGSFDFRVKSLNYFKICILVMFLV